MPNQTLYDNFSQVRQYIDQEKPDLSSYVTKTELSNCGYLTSIPVKYPTLTGFTIPSGATEIKFRSGGLNIDNSTYDLYPSNITYSSAVSQSNRTWVGMGTLKNYVDGRISEIESSYATTTYVADYVAEHGGGGSTVIDENIIPKETGTYTLGDNSYLYANVYTNNINYPSNGGWVKIGNNAKYLFTSSSFRPNSNNSLSLGASQYYWGTTYTANLYTDTAYLQNTSYSSSIVPKENNTYSLGSSNAVFSTIWTPVLNCSSTFRIKENNSIKYEFYQGVFQPASDKSIKLGDSDKKWAATYTADLYADNIHNFIWTGNSAEYAALSDYTTYQFYLIENE